MLHLVALGAQVDVCLLQHYPFCYLPFQKVIEGGLTRYSLDRWLVPVELFRPVHVLLTCHGLDVACWEPAINGLCWSAMCIGMYALHTYKLFRIQQETNVQKWIVLLVCYKTTWLTSRLVVFSAHWCSLPIMKMAETRLILRWGDACQQSRSNWSIMLRCYKGIWNKQHPT